MSRLKCVMRRAAVEPGVWRSNMALSLSLALRHERHFKMCVAPVKTSDAFIRTTDAASGIKGI